MYRKPFNITLGELVTWFEANEVVYCSDSTTGLKLICTLKGNFKIERHGKKVWTGMQPFAAVDKFNELSDELTNKKSHL